VIVTGRLEQRSWETAEGDKRSKIEVVADELGPSLRWATAQIVKKREARTFRQRSRRRGRSWHEHPTSLTTRSSSRRRGVLRAYDEEPF